MVAPNSPNPRANDRSVPVMIPGTASGKRDRRKDPKGRSAQGPRGNFQPAIDRLDRQPDRAHHQRKAHDGGSERGPRPSKRQRDPEPLVEQTSDGAVPAEQHQQHEAHDDRRQYQGKMNECVDERLARELEPCQSVGDDYRNRETADDAYEGHAKAQQDDAEIVRAEAGHLLHQAESVFLPDRARGRRAQEIEKCLSPRTTCS